MLRVLNILYDERLGGPQLRVLQVARKLPAHGVDTIVAMPVGDRTFATELTRAGVAFLELPLVRLRNTWNPAVHFRFLRLFWPNVRAIRRIIREHNVSVVHTNSLRHLQGAIAARLEGVPLVWHLNDMSTPRLLRCLLLPALVHWAHAVPVAARALIPHYFPDALRVEDRLHVLYAPVDPNRFAQPPERESVRAEFGLPPDCRLICTVANLNPGKGIEHLLESAPAVHAEHPKTRFLIVGGMGGNRPHYREHLLKRRSALGLDEIFILAGHRTDVPRILNAADICVHPSESEACPMAVLEAAASGRPVVATGVGGTAELVVHGRTGLLVEPRSPVQLTEAILNLLDDPAAAARMGALGAERVRECFSLDICAANHARVYSAAIGYGIRPAARAARKRAPENDTTANTRLS